MRRILFTICLLTISLHAWAARDGLFGDNKSEGDIRISLAILPSLQISVVSQVDVSINNPNIDADFEEYVCVTGYEGGRYNIIAQGNAGAFRLNNEDGDQLPYSVFFRGNPVASEFDELVAGETSPTYELMSSQSQCGTEYNFRIKFRAEDLQVVKSGLYTGTLNLLVSPV